MGYLRTSTSSVTFVTPTSERNVRNIDGGGVFNYMFIDHLKMQDSWGPYGGAWATGANWTSTILDANGYPNHSADGRDFGGGVRFRSSLNYSGNYVFDGIGIGTLAFVVGGGTTFTVNVGLSSNVTVNGNGNWSLTGSPFRVVFTYTGPRQLIGYRITSTDPGNTGAYLRSLRLYRGVDEADLIAGKVLCADWRLMTVQEAPSAFRFLDAMSVNGGQTGRWSHRTPPTYASWAGTNWNVSLPYGDATGTANAWTVAGVTGTPTSMQHGEVACARLVSGLVRSAFLAVTAITKANPGKVTTSSPHNYVTGDWVTFPLMTAGMTQLNYVPCQITVIDTLNFTIGVNTTSFSTFTAGNVCVYATLQVGSGSDRTPYPIHWPTGFEPIGQYGTAYFGAGSYVAFNFDKTISGNFNTSGVPTMGVWIAKDNGANQCNPPFLGMPVEIIGTIMNELNAASPTKPIDCWCPMPNAALLSMDPDYSSGENYVTNFLNVLLNGSGSYPGLLLGIKVLVENSNETWAGTPPNTQYYSFRGIFRYPGTAFGDFSSYATIRSQIMSRDVKAAFPGNTRIKIVMAGQGAYGYGGPNQIRVEGNSLTLNDALNPSHIVPMTEHDYFAFASYFDPASTSGLAALAATWVGNVGNAAAQEANCATFVNNQLLTGSGEQISRYIGLLPGYKAGIYTPFGKQIIGYEGGWNALISQSALVIGVVTSGANTISSISNNTTLTVGHYVVGPGISDGVTTLRPVATSSAGSATFSGGTSSYSGTVAFECYDASNLFLRACKRSQAWSDAYMSWVNQFNLDSTAFAMPPDFIQVEGAPRWGHCSPDAYDVGFAATAGYQNMEKLWYAMATRNSGYS